MEVQVERIPEARARIRVSLPVEDVTRAMDGAFKRLVARYNIPGFRPGKAPRPVFERYVGRDTILRDAAEHLVEDRYPDAIKQAGVKPVARPDVQIDELDADGPLVFTAEVPVKPVIELGDYRTAFREPLSVAEVTEEAIEAELRRVAEEEAQLVVATEEDPVASGSRLVIKIRGTRDGEEEPFVDTDDYPVTIGGGATLEGLELQLIGLHLNQESAIELTYPETYPDPALAGKPVHFEVQIKEHKRRDVPEVDDELARARSFGSLQELREDLTNSLRDRYEREAKEQRLNAVLARLKETVAVEVPEPMVAHQLDHQLQDLHHTLTHLGVDLDQYLAGRKLTLEGLLDEMRPGAAERVKDELILEAIAEAEGLTVSDEEVVAAVKSVADAYERPVNSLVENLKVSGEFETVRGNLLVDKAAQLVREPQPEIA
jgi:trigger factor